jgi:ABC-2 type transport system permease protein
VSARGAVLRSMPTLLRVGFAEVVAYRAEFLVWVLATTMPLIMMAVWTTVARDAPVGRFDQQAFVVYFLATFIVRQLASSWVAWQLNFEIRHGQLSMRLLRPVSPILTYATENFAALPLRGVVSLPVAAILLVTVGTGRLTHDPVLWALWVVSLAGAWAITFFAGVAIGALAFFVDSSAKVMELWLGVFIVLSGYTIPIELLPPAIRSLTTWLPFRYQLGLPVELMTGAHDVRAAAALLAGQWAWVACMALAAAVIWRRGLARFAAFGG